MLCILYTWNSGCYCRVTQAKTESNLRERYVWVHESFYAIDAADRSLKDFTSKKRMDAYDEQLQLVQVEVHRQVQEVQGSVSTLVQSVVQSQTQAIMTELQAVQAQMDKAVQTQFKEVYALVHSLSLRTPEQAPEHDAAREQGSGQFTRGSKRQAHPSITLVHSVSDEQASAQGNGQGSEPLEQRIKQYILGQRRQGNEPSLAEIMDRCACSKGSAIRYRRELGESHATGGKSVVGQ